MKKLVIIILVVGIVYYFKPELFPFNSGTGALDGNPEVWVFTSNHCGGWCQKSILEIERRQVSFKELQLDGNEENYKLYRKLGAGRLPYIVVGEHKVSGFHRAMIASVLAQTYGDKYLTEDEIEYYQNHFYTDGSPKIYMYGVNWCPYCKQMREEFANRNMDYVEINVDEASDRRFLVDTMQIDGFPIIYVGYRRVQGANINEVIKAKNSTGNRKF
jgi:glutaredoxin